MSETGRASWLQAGTLDKLQAVVATAQASARLTCIYVITKAPVVYFGQSIGFWGLVCICKPTRGSACVWLVQGMVQGKMMW